MLTEPAGFDCSLNPIKTITAGRSGRLYRKERLSFCSDKFVVKNWRVHKIVTSSCIAAANADAKNMPTSPVPRKKTKNNANPAYERE